MKILAVIPARAFSEGIPNKNIRIINGRPLIYYAIKNALDSKYITEVIVTTDSEPIRIVANQMGAGYKDIDKELCKDDVTLDAVVYDAIPKNEKWDYIVTIQSASLTLKKETLDNAIKYAVDNNLDTVISAINSPHLSWREEEGKKVPNYFERLNRQYLPPHYIETGAFMISKSDVITENNRIGKKVDIYEISREEGQDIETFTDLQSVAVSMQTQKVAIYVNGNNKRGMGHIYRALEIADEFYTKPDIYYDKNQTEKEIFGKTYHNLIAVNGIADLFAKCKKKDYNIFINDILTTSIDYMIGLRSVLPHAKIINIEDDGEGIHKADLVINALYNDSEFKQVYSGEKYYIAGKTFMFYNPITIKKKVEKVFITFGGADPQNYSDRLLNIISKEEYSKYKFIVVLGRAKHNIDKLLEYNNYSNIEVVYDISNMPELMSQCDVAVTSRGRTGYELAMLGIPSIVMAQNKREEKHGFISNENGFDYIGLNPVDEIIEMNLKMFLTMSKEGREQYHRLLLSHDLRNGRKRVMGLINNL